MLQNSFYHGKMVVKGKEYPHRYDTIISKELFDACTAVRLAKNSKTNAVKQTKNDFIFRSMITCAVSGRKVTPDIKKGKHVYLICRDPQNPDKKLFIPEKKVLAQIEAVFEQLHIPQELLHSLVAHLKNSHEAEKDFHQAQLKQLRDELIKIERKKDRLLDMHLDGSITQDIYDTKMPLL